MLLCDLYSAPVSCTENSPWCGFLWILFLSLEKACVKASKVQSCLIIRWRIQSSKIFTLHLVLLLLFCFSLFLGWAWLTHFCCFLGKFVQHFHYLEYSKIWNWFCIFQLQWMHICVYMLSMELVIYMNWFLLVKCLICVPCLNVVQISCRNIRFLVSWPGAYLCIWHWRDSSRFRVDSSSSRVQDPFFLGCSQVLPCLCSFWSLVCISFLPVPLGNI